MLQWEHSAILVTFIKLPIVIKIFILSFFEWPLYKGFTVYNYAVGIHMHFTNTIKNELTTSLKIELHKNICAAPFSFFAVTIARNVQNMKPAQFCRGYNHSVNYLKPFQ